MGSKDVTKNSDPKDDAVSPDGRPRSAVRQDMHTATDKPGKSAAPVARPGGGEPRDRSVDWLGRSLRQLYDGTAREPIPDKFRSLLDQLDERDGKSGGAKPAAGKPADKGDE